MGHRPELIKKVMYSGRSRGKSCSNSIWHTHRVGEWWDRGGRTDRGEGSHPTLRPGNCQKAITTNVASGSQGTACENLLRWVRTNVIELFVLAHPGGYPGGGCQSFRFPIHRQFPHVPFIKITASIHLCTPGAYHRSSLEIHTDICFWRNHPTIPAQDSPPWYKGK